MELRITDPTQTLDSNFGSWLIPKISVKIQSQMYQYNLKQLDDYINTSDSVSRLYTRDYKTTEIIKYISENLVNDSISGLISIKINNTLFIPGFDRFRVDIAAKLINFGATDLKPVPIFTNVFAYFAKNIDTFIDFYYYEIIRSKEQ